MESFGEYLKSLREERDISLQRISEKTKIAVTNLDLLEQDRYDLLPPRVFVKGFIRSYAAELGLDPEELTNRFDDFTKEGELRDYQIEEHPLFQQQSRSRLLIGNPVFTIVLTAAGILALGILLVAGFGRLYLGNDNVSSGLPTVTRVGPAGLGSSPSGTRGGERPYRSAFKEPPPVQAGSKILEIKALANSWVRVQSDSGPAEEMIMVPGEETLFTARERFQLQTGNAGGIRLRFDGRELPALGKENQSLSLTLP